MVGYLHADSETFWRWRVACTEINGQSLWEAYHKPITAHLFFLQPHLFYAWNGGNKFQSVQWNWLMSKAWPSWKHERILFGQIPIQRPVCVHKSRASIGRTPITLLEVDTSAEWSKKGDFLLLSTDVLQNSRRIWIFVLANNTLTEVSYNKSLHATPANMMCSSLTSVYLELNLYFICLFSVTSALLHVHGISSSNDTSLFLAPIPRGKSNRGFCPCLNWLLKTLCWSGI